MTTICIHQPDFAPWLGFFDRLLDSDIFIVLDDAQFIHDGWHHRDRIKTRQGQAWITLPINKSDKFKPINQVRLAENRDEWVRRHLNLLIENYRQAACFAEVFPRIEAVYRAPSTTLAGINLAYLDLAYELLDLHPKTVRASELAVATTRNQRLIDLCQAVGGTTYLSGTGALAYLDPDLFRSAGIDVVIQSFTHPIYPQLHGPFVPQLSSLDVFFNCGRDAARILRSGRVGHPPTP